MLDNTVKKFEKSARKLWVTPEMLKKMGERRAAAITELRRETEKAKAKYIEVKLSNNRNMGGSK